MSAADGVAEAKRRFTVIDGGRATSTLADRKFTVTELRGNGTAIGQAAAAARFYKNPSARKALGKLADEGSRAAREALAGGDDVA